MPLMLKVRQASNREARTATAARGGIGIGHLERRAAEVLDEIDRGSAHQVEADRIDHQLHPVGFGDGIVLGLRLGQLELVGEAGAAAAVDRQAQDRGPGLRSAIQATRLAALGVRMMSGSLTGSEIGCSRQAARSPWRS